MLPPLSSNVLNLTVPKVFRGELVLVQITSPLPPWSDIPAANTGPASAAEQAQRQAATYLHMIAKRLEDAQVRVQVMVGAGDVATSVALLAQRHDAALVIMATHGRTGNLRTALGAVARSLLWHCDLPILLLQPAAPARTREGDECLALFAPRTDRIEPGAPA